MLQVNKHLMLPTRLSALAPALQARLSSCLLDMLDHCAPQTSLIAPSPRSSAVFGHGPQRSSPTPGKAAAVPPRNGLALAPLDDIKLGSFVNCQRLGQADC